MEVLAAMAPWWSHLGLATALASGCSLWRAGARLCLTMPACDYACLFARMCPRAAATAAMAAGDDGGSGGRSSGGGAGCRSALVGARVVPGVARAAHVTAHMFMLWYL